MSYTFKLSETWDLQLTDNGDIAVTRGSAAIAQDVANACRLFTDDALYHADTGIDWANKALGKKVQYAIVKNELRNAALATPGVRSVTSLTLEDLDNETRTLKGEIRITTEDGENGRAIL